MGAGGTSGGVDAFFAGAAMVVAGGYLLLTRVSVMSGGFQVYGYNAFGLSLVPLLLRNRRAVLQWPLDPRLDPGDSGCGDHCRRHPVESASLLSADLALRHAD